MNRTKLQYLKNISIVSMPYVQVVKNSNGPPDKAPIALNNTEGATRALEIYFLL